MNYALVSTVVNRVNVRVCHLQWNSVNTASIGPKKKIGRINGVAVLTTVFFTRKCMAVFARQPKPLLYVIYF